jgi:tripartite-type tricarboxylate transporter receptor subunit TctC
MTAFRVGRRAAMAIPLAAPAAEAQPPAWRPERPVTIVLPFAAGAGSDILARLFAAALEPALGQRVLVDNRPGGNGVPASMHVVRAPADGHTLMLTSGTTHSANPALLRRMEYDPVADFAPITTLGSYIFLFAVGAELPARNLAEFLALARARPGQLTYASGNATGIVGGATIARLGNVEMTHVPYRSTPPAMTDLLAGRVSAMVVDTISALPQIRDGRLRPLAVLMPERTPLLPEVPTLAEAGLPGYDIISWAALFGPARLPEPVVRALNAAVRERWPGADPALRARFGEIGFVPGHSSPEELGEQVRRDILRWGEAIRRAGIQPE